MKLNLAVFPLVSVGCILSFSVWLFFLFFFFCSPGKERSRVTLFGREGTNYWIRIVFLLKLSLLEASGAEDSSSVLRKREKKKKKKPRLIVSLLYSPFCFLPALTGVVMLASVFGSSLCLQPLLENVWCEECVGLVFWKRFFRKIVCQKKLLCLSGYFRLEGPWKWEKQGGRCVFYFGCCWEWMDLKFLVCMRVPVCYASATLFQFHKPGVILNFSGYDKNKQLLTTLYVVYLCSWITSSSESITDIHM